MRRQFQLPEEDIVFLNSLELPWETVVDQGMEWVLVQNYPVCQGYTCENVTLAVKIETGYPRTPLDMAYFFPALQRKDGKGINATSFQPIDGKLFQRWSRHRTPRNPWREGVDDLSAHLSLVNFWFEEEFKKQPNGITT